MLLVDDLFAVDGGGMNVRRPSHPTTARPAFPELERPVFVAGWPLALKQEPPTRAAWVTGSLLIVGELCAP